MPNNLPNEATVTVNGELLSSAESMTLRVALELFAMDLLTNGLGDDATGKSIAAGYKEAAKTIHQKMRKSR